LNLNIPDVGNLVGRALLEATPKAQWWNGTTTTQVSDRDARGQRTIVATQAVGKVRYFDAAGYPGRSVGLPELANAGKAD
jgi:hypothetical protein